MSARRHTALAAALLLALAAPARAQIEPDQLGRLFATPAERAQLDARRGVQPAPQAAAVAPDQPPDGPPVDNNNAVAAAAPAPPQPVHMNGLVRSSNGRTTVWLDGMAQSESSAQLLKGKQVQMHLSSGRRVILKPGQSFNPVNGKVQDLTTPEPPRP